MPLSTESNNTKHKAHKIFDINKLKASLLQLPEKIWAHTKIKHLKIGNVYSSRNNDNNNTLHFRNYTKSVLSKNTAYLLLYVTESENIQGWQLLWQHGC